MNITIIDYDIGNVKSIINALEKVNVKPLLSRKKEDILNADGVILPGVGAFKYGMDSLEKYDLITTILEYTNSDKPFLGICLGMQMLLEESEEFGFTRGLGIIEGKIVKLPVLNSDYEKLPHVSWNEITPKDITWKNTILENIIDKSDMYFVHSYVAMPNNESNILSQTVYSDYSFTSSIKKGNVYGCQFHPEKSGVLGLEIINNFVKICKEKQ